MSNESNDINWQDIGRKLRAPFNPNDVDFRVQGRVNEQTGKGQVVAYIDARSVQDRLDEVVQPGNWAFEWEPVVVDKGDVQVAKGTLTIHGVSKSDVGTASNFEASLGAVSHCFKRAAVHFGIGRYLYGISSAYVAIEKGGRISDETLRNLRAKLPRPTDGKTAPASTPRGNPAAQTERATPTPSPTPSASERATAHDAQDTHAEMARRAGYPGVTPAQPDPRRGEPQASAQQLASIHKLCNALGRITPTESMTYARAREVISELSEAYRIERRKE